VKTTNTSLLILLFLFGIINLSAQNELTSEIISEHTYSFSIQEGRLVGEGAEVLTKSLEGSQFFLLGEYHNDAGISELTSAILKVLSKHGYHHFAIEVGPLSATKLEELGKARDVERALRVFTNEQLHLTGEIPIPFFGGKEDALFLETALKEGYELWGLDQEYLGGYLFLLERVWQEAGMPENKRSSYEAARKSLLEGYNLAQNEDNAGEIYNLVLNDEIIQSFILSIEKEESNWHSCRCHFSALEELITSCEIYRDWSRDRFKNLNARNKLMKSHFVSFFQNSGEKLPKVFVKMGGMHTGRGFTGNANYEIGNLLHELAVFNGTKDINVAFATRYYLDEETGEIGDNLEFDSEWTRNMQSLLEQGDQELWKLVDLEPLKRLWINKRLKVSPQIKAYLQKNDFVIIMPPLGDTTPNYDLSKVSPH
jgi:hypothetical protein